MADTFFMMSVDQLPLSPLATNSISFVLGISCHVCTCPGKSLLSHQRSLCILRMTLKLLWLPAISEKCFTTGISSEGEGQTYLLPIRYNPGLRFFCSTSRPTLRTCISSRPCSYRRWVRIPVPHYLWARPLSRFRCYPEVWYLHILFIVAAFEPLTHFCQLGLSIMLTTKKYKLNKWKQHISAGIKQKPMPGREMLL